MSVINHAVTSPGKSKEILTGVVVLGAAGVISTSTCEGFTVVKTATETGRYTCTLAKTYKSIEFGMVSVEGTADATSAAAKGQVSELRNVVVGTKTMDFQLVTPSLAGGASVDVNAEDSAILRFFIIAKRGML